MKDFKRKTVKIGTTLDKLKFEVKNFRRDPPKGFKNF